MYTTPKEIINLLTVLVHGDITFGATLLHAPQIAMQSIGLNTRNDRPILALSPIPELTHLQLPYFVTLTTLPEPIDACLDDIRATLLHETTRQPINPQGSWPCQPIIVNTDPIPRCHEDLIAPPGDGGGPLWTMCSARSNLDKQLAVRPNQVEPQLLPGTEVFENQYFTTLRHGARLIRIAGDHTRDALHRIISTQEIPTNLFAQAAIARLSSRGLVVARIGDSDTATHRWAVASASPSVAHALRKTTTTAIIPLDSHIGQTHSILTRTLKTYDLKTTSEPGLASHIMITTTTLAAPDLKTLSRSLTEQKRQWSLLWTGPAGWCYTHGIGDTGACPWCIVQAIKYGPMNAFALDTSAHVPPITHSGERAIGRAIARALAGIVPPGTLTVIRVEPDMPPEVEWVERNPTCEACGRPTLHDERTRATTLLSQRLVEEISSPDTTTQDIDQTLLERRFLHEASWTGRYPQRHTRQFDVDPNATTLHHVMHALPWPGRHGRTGPSITGGKGTTPRQTLLSAMAETLEATAANWTHAHPGLTRWTSQRTLENENQDVIPPNAIQRFSKRQHTENARIGIVMRTATYIPKAYDPSCHNTTIGWIQARDLETDESAWVPTQAALLAAPAPPQGENDTRWLVATNYGLACAPTRMEALTRGILELIERDAKSWWWMLRRVRPRVPLRGWHEPWLNRIERIYERAHRRIHAIDITTTPLARTVLVVSALTTPKTDGNVERIATTACELTLKDALLSAATEHAQCLPSTIDANALPGADPKCEEIRAWRAIGWPAPPWLEGKSVRIKPYRTLGRQHQRTHWRYRRALKAARAAGAERLLGVDLTQQGETLTTTRIIAPGLRSTLLEKAPGRYDTTQPWFDIDDCPRDEHELPNLACVQ